MSKNNYPKGIAAKIVRNFDDLMESKPAEEIELVTPPVGAEETTAPPTGGKNVAGSEEQPRRAAPPNEEIKKTGKLPVMTYFSESNYDEFEDMYNEVKRRMRRETGRKLAESPVTEAAVMFAVGEFRRDPEGFFSRIKKILEQ